MKTNSNNQITTKRLRKMIKRFKSKGKVCRCSKNKNGHHNLRKLCSYTPQVVCELVATTEERGTLLPLGDIDL